MWLCASLLAPLETIISCFRGKTPTPPTLLQLKLIQHFPRRKRSTEEQGAQRTAPSARARMHWPSARKIVIGRASVDEAKQRNGDSAHEEEAAAVKGPAERRHRIAIAMPSWNDLSIACRVELAVHCQHAFLKHVLYVLALLPAPFQQVVSEVNEMQIEAGTPSTKSIRDQQRMTKLQALVGGISSSLADASTLSTERLVLRCCLGIGTSINNLRLVISLSTADLLGDSAGDIAQSITRSMDRMKRLFSMKMVENDAVITSHRVPPSGQLFIFFELDAIRSQSIATDGVPQWARGRYVLQQDYHYAGKKSTRTVDISTVPQEIDSARIASSSTHSQWLLPLCGIPYTRVS